MSKASGILLIAVGVGVAVYAMPSGNDGADQQPIPEIAVAKVAPTGVSATTAKTDAAAALPNIVPPIPKAAVRPAKGVNDSEPGVAKLQAKPTVVATTQRVYEKPVSVERTAVPALIPGDRVGLARELQRELRRVGCYDGEINGTWTPASRRAMKVFTDRVNASLPVEQPDYILLKLVQGSPERICGASCPAGQGMAGDGRCLPSAVVAHAARKATNPVLPATATTEKPGAVTSGWATTTTAAARNLPPVPEGRMALAGPNDEAVAPLRRPTSGDDRSTLAAVTQTPDETSYRAQERVERPLVKKPKLATVENVGRRDEPPRKKFGPWFFRQQEAWRN